jgi:hypothetical protein
MPVLCRIYGTNTYSSIYATYDTDGDSEPGKYTSGLYLRNGSVGMEYDASGTETMNIIHGYAGGAASPIYFRFGGSAGNIRMTLNDAGHLGLGVTPCGALDAHKPGSGALGTGDNLIVRGGNNNNAFGTNQIRFGYSGGIGYSHAIKSRHNSGGNSQNALDFFLWTTADCAETVGSKNVMTLESTGNVGMGTCTPNISGFTGTMLTLNGTGNYQGLEISTCGGARMTMLADISGTLGYISTRQAGMSLVFETGAASEKMRINCSGNVGINCSAPGSKLTVGGTLTTTDTITTTSGTVSNYLTYTATTGVIGTQTNHALQIRTNDTERIRVTCTGCIGVNITSPTYTLHVNGTFYAAGSSKEYKTSICEYNTDSCMFMKLKPVTYDYKEEWKHLGKQLKSGTQIGLIAEDTAEVFPELAVLKEEENEQVVRNVDYEKLSVILLSEVQKLRREVDDLKHKQ